MRKQIVIYQENKSGKIAKFIGGVECVDGEVVNEGHESDSGSFASRAWSWFFGHGATVGGNAWEESTRVQDNGKEYNPKTGEWKYRVDLGGNRKPTHIEQTIIPGYGDSSGTDGTT